jgi:hypothetical protein
MESVGWSNTIQRTEKETIQLGASSAAPIAPAGRRELDRVAGRQ